MNVKDLIENLKTFAGNSQVLVRGYEDGYDSVKSITEIVVTRNLNAADYNGEYDDAETGAKVVVIMGNRR